MFQNSLPKYFIFIATAFLFIACSSTNFNPKWTEQTAPETFTARFETSQGNFDVAIERRYSPKAVDRLYQLLNHHFYDNTLFYRVVPDFVVQFGNGDTLVSKKWDKFKIPDEPVLKSNLKGTVSYARDGKETRGNDLFINLKDNVKLDTRATNEVTGYPPFGEVIKGMDVVEKLYSGYGNATLDVYDSLSSNRNEFLKRFPKLDSIKKAYILKKK